MKKKRIFQLVCIALALLFSFGIVQAQTEIDSSESQVKTKTESKPDNSENAPKNKVKQDTKKANSAPTTAPEQMGTQSDTKASSSSGSSTSTNAKKSLQDQKDTHNSNTDLLKKNNKNRKQSQNKKRRPVLYGKQKAKKETKRAETEKSPPAIYRESGTRSAPSENGLIKDVPNFEKDFLPGYLDLINLNRREKNSPHEAVAVGRDFFSNSAEESSGGKAKDSIKGAIEKKWEENMPSKRTLINLSILVVLALGLLLYRIRSGHFSK